MLHDPVRVAGRGSIEVWPVARFLWLLLLAGFHQNSTAQSGVTVWADSCSDGTFYGRIISSGYSDFTQVHTLPNGDIIAVGTIKDRFTQMSVERNYAHVMRLKASGGLVWSKFVGVLDPAILIDFRAYASVIASNGDIVICLSNNSGVLKGNYMVRMKNDGTLVWQKNIPYLGHTSSSEIFTELVETADGGFFVVGFTVNIPIYMKLDAGGDMLWRRGIISTQFNSNITAAAEGASAYYFVGKALSSRNGNSFTGNYLTAIDKTSGELIWAKWLTFAGAAQPLTDFTEYEYDFINYRPGVLALTGSTRVNYAGANKRGQVAVYVDETGNPLRAERIESPAWAMEPANIFHSSLYDPFMKMGISFQNADSSDFHVYKFNENNTAAWAWRIPRFDIQTASDSRVLRDTGFVAVGFNRAAANSISACMLKVAAAGQLDNCSSVPYTTQITALSPTSQNIIDIQSEPYDVESISASSLDTIAGHRFRWQLECASFKGCWLSKIKGNRFGCINTATSFSAVKKGACNGPILFSATGPHLVQQLSDSTADITFLSEGTFTVYAVTQAECGQLKDSIIVEVQNLNQQFTLGPDSVICPGNSFQLYAAGSYVSYLWQDGSTDSAYRVTAPGTYFVQVTDACAKTYADTMLVAAAPAFIFSAGPDRQKCNEDTLQVNATEGFYNYTWTPGYNITVIDDRNVVINPATDTVYYLVAEKFPGCLAYDTVRVQVKNTPRINLGRDTFICKDQRIVLDAGAGFDAYTWSSGTPGQLYTATQGGSYAVTGYHSNGCTFTDSINIDGACLNELFFPTAFAPNGNAVNEVFRPKTSQVLSEYRLQVFNRWGQVIFETADLQEGWDGKYKNEIMRPGVYAWVCQYRIVGKLRNIKRGTMVLVN